MTRARQSGLTLLELLVAISLLGLLGAAAAGGLSFGLAVWDRASGFQEQRVEARLVRKFLSRQIAAAEPIVLRGNVRDVRLFFDGAASTLSFPAPLPAHLAPPGGQLIHLSREGTQLTLRWAPLGDRRPVIDATAQREVLLDDVASLTFAYFGPPEGGGPPIWQPVWQNRSRLPQMVRIEIRSTAETSRAWAPLVIGLAQGGRL